MAGHDARPQLGRLGERLAGEHLERLGYTLLARNFRTPWGELDIVACDARTLVFCEVKTRRQGPGSPWDSLGRVKQCRVRRMASVWLAITARPHRQHLRFDAVGVTIDARGELVALDHVEGAF